jgi:serine/threonine protein phosphatase PrpC
MSQIPTRPGGYQIPALTTRILTVCGRTNVGLARNENQDTFAVVELASGRTNRPCIRTDVSVIRPGVLLLVCDGMGGPPAGDVAAKLAAVSIEHKLAAEGNNVCEEPKDALKRAVVGANQIIFEEAEAHPEEHGMGTTCTVAIVAPDRLTIAQVGDSRAYLLRAGRLFPLTRDQSMVEALVDAGQLTPDQAQHSKLRHLLAQALGTTAKVRPVITDVTVREGDRVLLCSDGLHGPVTDEAIAAILLAAPDVAHASQTLIKAALDAGGPDNITVVVADYGPLTP